MAKEKKVIFRCDAARHIGGGHVMRCITLAGGLKKSGFDCSFIVNDAAAKLVTVLAQEKTSTDDFRISETDVLVVDHYGLDAAYEKNWRKQAKVIVAIDDLANRAHECNVLIDQTYGRAAADYKARVPKDCVILAGSDYSLLRPQFANLRAKTLTRREDTRRAERVLVSFGLSNVKGVTEFALRALAKFKDYKLEIDVVAGSFAENLEAVKKAAAAEKFHKVNLHIDTDDMAKLMAEADIAIGAGGTTSWERCSLGLPAIVIQLAGNQSEITSRLAKAGAIKSLGPLEMLTEGVLLAAFSGLVGDDKALKEMAENAAAIADGEGVTRVVNEVLKLL